MPDLLALLDRATIEGLDPHRRAVLLAAISRESRLHINIMGLINAALENVPKRSRAMLRPEIERIANALAIALEELAREARTDSIRTGPDSGPSRAAAEARAAFDLLDKRMTELRPTLIRSAGVLEVGNLNAFCNELQAMTGLIERPLDEPPTGHIAARKRLPRSPAETDNSALFRYCCKVALCLVAGFVIGLTTQRPGLSTILTTIIITALPTYGAALRKMILRLVGTIAGGVLTILSVIVVTPNFESLPSYMLITLAVLFISAYGSLSSSRVSYAGKQIGTTYLLAFAALSPSADVYAPLWRVWGILLGTLVVTIVFFLLWPEYAGDSLVPRILQMLRDSIALIPGHEAASDPEVLHETNAEITQLFTEILQVADDARLEGRKSLIDPDALVNASGVLRRIAHRLANLSMERIKLPLPALSPSTNDALNEVYNAVQTRLESWAQFFSRHDCLTRRALDLSASHSRDEIARPLEEFSMRLQANGYAEIAGWRTDQRRQILARLQSLRRVEFLISELEDYISHVPGADVAELQPVEVYS